MSKDLLHEGGPFDHVFESFPVLETERLRLREMVVGDAEAVYQIFGDPEVTRYYDLETFREMGEAVALIERQKERFRQKQGIRWGITLKGADVVIGTVGMMLTAENRQGGIGYDLARPYWRRGIMTEVLQAVIQFAFDNACVERIQALVMPGNTASFRLLQKLGFEHKGLLKDHAYFKGRHQDLHNFILTKSKRQELTQIDAN